MNPMDKNKTWEEISKKYEINRMMVRSKIALAIGIDKALKYMDKDYVVHPINLIEGAVNKGFITPDEIDKRLWDEAVDEAEDVDRTYRDSGEGIGSSDMNAFIYNMLKGAGFDMYVDKNSYKRRNKMAKGGAIYKGDKVRIKDTNKSMVVKNIAKGKKGYVEFSGNGGTYLKGDLEKYAKGGSPMPNYTKTMNLVKVKFNNPKYNYSTSVSSDVTESEARKYFVGKMFDVGVYPKENMQKAVDIEFFPKGTYSEEMAKGGMTEHGLKLGDKIVSDFDTDLDKKRGRGRHQIGVKDKKGEMHYVNLDKGWRYEKGGYMAKGGKMDEKPKTPKGKKMKEKEPQIVRGYFDDEPYEYAKGGKTDCWCYEIGGL